jgi:hypothetical protein
VSRQIDIINGLLKFSKELEKENGRLKHEVDEAEKQRDDFYFENEQLKQQIEKMKCCDNCKYSDFTESGFLYCTTHVDDCMIGNPCEYNKWELVE